MTAYGTKPKLPDAPTYVRYWLENRHRRRSADPTPVHEHATQSVLPPIRFMLC